MRSIGPLTLTAAITAPSAARTGALTDATPASRSATLSAHPRFKASGSPRKIFPAEPASRGSARAEGHDRAQTVRRLECLDTHSAVALSHVQLHALPCLVAQRLEGGPGHLRQPQSVGSCPSERDESETEGEATVAVATHEAVGFERDGQSIGRRAGQADVGHELRQRPRFALESGEHRHRLVEHSHSAYTAVHKPRL